ncbi:unnamed protein product, partial [Polarella glacialis]
ASSIRIDGQTAPAARPALVAQFQEDSAIRVAVLSITAAGSGLTLTAAQTVVFAELYWVPGQMMQAEDRAHRIGQRDCVTVQYLVARGTLDETLYRTLEKKSLSVNGILNGCRTGLDASRQTLESAAAESARGARVPDEPTVAPAEPRQAEVSTPRAAKRARLALDDVDADLT